MKPMCCRPLTPFAVVFLAACASDPSGGSGDSSAGGSTSGSTMTGSMTAVSATTMATSSASGSPTTTMDSGNPDSSGPSTATESGSTGPADCPETILPGSIDGVEPESHSHHPPIIDGNGNLYRIVESPQDDGNEPKMMKSDDGGATWAEVDGGNRPDASDLEGTYQLQVGTRVFFTVTRGSDVWFFAFDTSDGDNPDTWLPTEQVDEDLSNGSVVQFSSLAQLQDGSFWLAYSDTLVSGRQQIALRPRDPAGVYGAKISVDVDSGSWTGPRLVSGSDDTTHLFYKDDLDHHVYWRTIAPDGELSRATQVDADGSSQEPIPHTHPVVFEVDGQEVIAFAMANGDDQLAAVTIVDGALEPEETLSDDPVLQNPPVLLNEGAVAHVALAGTTVHAVWTDDATGAVLHRSKAASQPWSEVATLWSMPDANASWLYCTVLTNFGCPRLGCTLDVGPHEDDIGDIQYLEFPL